MKAMKKIAERAVGLISALCLAAVYMPFGAVFAADAPFYHYNVDFNAYTSGNGVNLPTESGSYLYGVGYGDGPGRVYYDVSDFPGAGQGDKVMRMQSKAGDTSAPEYGLQPNPALNSATGVDGCVYMEAKVKFSTNTQARTVSIVRSTTGGDTTSTVLQFAADGTVKSRNAYENPYTVVKTGYSANIWYSLKFKFDMDAKKYYVWIGENGGAEELVTNGFNIAGGTGFEQIGRIRIQSSYSADEDVAFVIDDVKLYTIQPEIINALPNVEITSPADKELISAGSDIEITADATDDGSIVKVEFYRNGVKIGEDATYPYSFLWTAAEAGSWLLTAKATDNYNASAVSGVVQLEVGSDALITETLYTNNFNGYTAAMGNTSPSGMSAWVASDGKMGGVDAPENSAWGKSFKLQSDGSGQIGMPVPKPSNGIVIMEGDFRFEGFSGSRTLLAPRYDSGAGTIANVLTLNGNKFMTKNAAFQDVDTGFRAEENIWYHIRVIIDIDRHLYAVEVNGQTIVQPSTISYGVSFNSVYLYGYSQAAGENAMYIDNLSATRAAPSSVSLSVSAPYNNQVFQYGESIAITAVAATSAGAVSKVEYYDGASYIGEAASAPYSFIWNNPPAGAHTVTAKGYSTLGAAGVSIPVNIDVKSVVLPSIFGDGMILQREADINVYGSGINGQTVTAVFNGQTKTAEVSGGKWNITFPPLSADKVTEYTLEISNGIDFSKTITNIKMGEVWVCGGQSNMERAFLTDLNYETEKNNADYPDIKLFFQDANPMATPQPDVKNGSWKACTPNTVRNFSAVGYYFGKYLHTAQASSVKDVPVGLIFAAVGGTQIASWLSETEMTGNPALDGYRTATAGGAGSRAQYGLYNGMLHPILPFAAKGMIWYQGESDANLSGFYEEALTSFITGLREETGNPGYAVHIVQITEYNDVAANQRHVIRDAELKVSQKMENAGLVVTIDIGDPNDVHPLNKGPVGERLALVARKLTYGENIETYMSPIGNETVISGNKITVKFDQAGTGLHLSAGTSVNDVEICDMSEVYYPAYAVVNGDTIECTAPEVSFPVGVRYGYKNCPSANLFNSINLPASPFNLKYAPASIDGNLIPTVSFDQTDFAYLPGSSALIKVNSSDADGYIRKTELYRGNVKIGEVVGGGAKFTAENLQEGENRFTAVVTDNSGCVVISEPAAIEARSYTDADIYRFNESFDDYTAENGTTWPAAFADDTVGWETGRVVSGLTPGGEPSDRAMVFDTRAGAANTTLATLFSPATSAAVTFETDLYFEKYVTRSIFIRSGANSRNVEIVRFSADGDIISRASQFTDVKFGEYAADGLTKYNLKIVFNPSDRKYRVYLDGDKKLDKLVDYNSDGSYDTLSGFSMVQNASADEDVKMYVNNFKLSSAAVSATVTSAQLSNAKNGLALPDGAVTLKFSEAMDTSTLTADNIKLVDGDGNAVSYTPNASAAEYALNYSGLSAGKFYRAVIGAGVKTLAGIPFGKSLSYGFTAGENGGIYAVEQGVLEGVSEGGATFKLYNQENTGKNASVIAAAYKGGRLVSVSAVRSTVDANGSVNISALTDAPGGAEVKLFVWDGFSGLKPIEVK